MTAHQLLSVQEKKAENSPQRQNSIKGATEQAGKSLFTLVKKEKEKTTKMRDQYSKKVMVKNTTTAQQLCSQNLRAEFFVICPSVNHTGGFSKVSTFLIVTLPKSWLFSACVTVDHIQPPIRCSLSEKEHCQLSDISKERLMPAKSVLAFFMFFCTGTHSLTS